MGHVPSVDVVEQPRGTRWPARRWVSAGLLVALLAAMAVYFSGSGDELASIQRLSIQILALTGALQFVSQLCQNASLLRPLQQCVTRLGFWEFYLLRTGGVFAGWLVPVAGGLAVRLAYLRGRGLTYLEFTWATLLSNVLALGAAALLASAAIGVLWATAGPPPGPVLGITAGLFAVSIAAAMAFEYLPRLTRRPALRKWRWLSEMSSLNTSRRMATEVFALSLGRHLLNFVTFGLLYRALSGGPSDFLTGGLVYALTTPVRMVNITPGNVGVAEWFVALVGRMAAFDVMTGLIVALAFRVIGLAAQGLGAAFGSAWVAAGRRS